MDLYPLELAVATLEVSLATEPSAGDIVELAWGLRQRDSRRALELADGAERMQASPAVTVRANLVRAEVAALRGEFERAEEALSLALGASAAFADPTLEGDAAMAEAAVAHAQAQRDRYMSAWERAADCYGRAGDSSRRSLARGWLAFLGAHSDRELSAQQVAKLREENPAPRHPALEALLHASDGMLGYSKDVAASAAAAYQASLYARECGLVRHAIVSSMNAGTAMQNIGDYDGAARAYDWAAVEARKTGWPGLVGASLMRMASLHRELGQFEAAEQGFREALEAFARLPGGISKAEAHAGLGNTLVKQGRGAEAIPLLRTAAELFRGESSMDGLTVNLLMLSRALAQHGEAAEARRVFAEAESMVADMKLARLRVDVSEARAELLERSAFPAPEGASARQAAAQCLEEGLAAGYAIEGWQPNSRLLLRLARAWADAGDATRSFRFSQQAFEALQQENIRRATNAAAVMRARNDLERQRAEMAHQRELIAALESASHTDPLTGLRNRRFVQEHIELDVAQALRRHAEGKGAEGDLLFFLADIDHFKQVNDVHGHAAGDAVLVQMRERLASVFRDSDWLVRWGGEEFLVVARAASRADAAQLAERVRIAVASRPFAIGGGTSLEKTCSIGFAAFPFTRDAPQAIGWQETVDIADAGLYLAKRNGRNAWVGLSAKQGADLATYAARIKTDAKALIESGEVRSESSLPQLGSSSRKR